MLTAAEIAQMRAVNDRQRALYDHTLLVARGIVEDEPSGELDFESLALLAALCEWEGFAERAKAFNAAAHPRNPKGSPGGGRFRSLVDRIKDALDAHAKGDGKGDPFDGFNREQLRRVAKARGIDLKPGEHEDSIKKKLLDHLGGGKPAKATAPSAPKTPATKEGARQAYADLGGTHLNDGVQLNALRERWGGTKEQQDEQLEAMLRHDGVVLRAPGEYDPHKLLERAKAGDPAIKVYMPARGNEGSPASSATDLQEFNEHPGKLAAPTPPAVTAAPAAPKPKRKPSPPKATKAPEPEPASTDFDAKHAATSFEALDAAPTRGRVLFEARLSPEKRREFHAKLAKMTDAQQYKLGGAGARATIDPDEKLGDEEASRILASIDDYMKTGYFPINRALHDANGGPLGGDVPDDVRQKIEDIDRLLDLSRLETDSILHRGTRFVGDPPDELDAVGFNSATAHYGVARDFAMGEFAGIETGSTSMPGTPTVMEIRVPKGTSAVQLSPMHVAAEVLLPRGLKLRKVDDKGMVDGVRYVVYEVVPSGR
jgi:hypothetical protein